MTPLERARNAVLATRYPGITFSDTLSPEISEAIHEIGKSDEIARAVLLAIREPSEGMLEAGLDKARECTDNWQSVAACLPGHCWTAMIDAALSDGE